MCLASSGSISLPCDERLFSELPLYLSQNLAGSHIHWPWWNTLPSNPLPFLQGYFQTPHSLSILSNSNLRLYLTLHYHILCLYFQYIIVSALKHNQMYVYFYSLPSWGYKSLEHIFIFVSFIVLLLCLSSIFSFALNEIMSEEKNGNS